jgi:hypothetical protein
MIPSDHFVRFYNEVFKYLDNRNDGSLEKYWQHISLHQERHCLELFKSKGLQGMYEYWEHIRIEENCDMTLTLHSDHLETHMLKCPSLSKAIENDAGPFTKYCDHCPGWIGPLLRRAGFYLVYDMIDRTKPQCSMYIYKDKAKAEKRAVGLRKQSSCIVLNF